MDQGTWLSVSDLFISVCHGAVARSANCAKAPGGTNDIRATFGAAGGVAVVWCTDE